MGQQREMWKLVQFGQNRQMFGVSKIFFKHINTFILQGCIKLIKSAVKTCIMLQTISISNKCCSFELSIHQRILKKWITVSAKLLSSTTVFNIRNVS